MASSELSDEMQELVEKCEGVQFVRWVFCDMNGNARSKIIPGKMCAAFVKRGGRDVCSATFGLACNAHDPDIRWIIENGYPDCAVLPDPKTFHLVTWSKSSANIGQVLCSSKWHDGSPVSFDPRNVAIKQLQQLQQMGFELLSAFEPEWRLFVTDTASASGYAWHENSSAPYSSSVAHKYEQLLCDICDALASAGITVEAVHTEFGTGQMEITVVPAWGIHAADHAFLYREIVKQVGSNHNYIISFMPVPYADEAGNGLHLNHSLWSADRSSNVFHDSAQPHNMSVIMQQWVAGLCQHAPAIAALTSPTINCYRRLHKPFTPSFCDWEINSRNATFRVKSGASASSTYVENRAASSAANAYILLAATLAAGIDGIQRQLQLPQQAVRDPGCKLPASMQQAVQVLLDDQVIVQALGQQTIEFYTEIKKQFDLAKVDKHFDDPGDQLNWEFKHYLEHL